MAISPAAAMSSSPSVPSSAPAIPKKGFVGTSPFMTYELFEPKDFIPPEILVKIRNPIEAKNLGFFFYERNEAIIGVTTDAGFLTKVFTRSADNVTRTWAKKMGTNTHFTLFAEMKPPKNKPSVSKLSTISKSSIDDID